MKKKRKRREKEKQKKRRKKARAEKKKRFKDDSHSYQSDDTIIYPQFDSKPDMSVDLDISVDLGLRPLERTYAAAGLQSVELAG